MVRIVILLFLFLKFLLMYRPKYISIRKLQLFFSFLILWIWVFGVYANDNQIWTYIKDVFVPVLTFLLLTFYVPYYEERKNNDDAIQKLKIYAVSHKIHELLIIWFRFFEKIGINNIESDNKIHVSSYIVWYEELLKFLKYKYPTFDSSDISESAFFSNDIIYKSLKNQDLFFDSWKKSKRGTKNIEYEKIDIDYSFKEIAENNFKNGFESIIKMLDIIINNQILRYKNNSNKLNNECSFSVDKNNISYNLDYNMYIDILKVTQDLESKIYLKWWIKDNEILNQLWKIIEILNRIIWKINDNSSNLYLSEHYWDFYLLFVNLRVFYNKYEQIFIKTFFDFEDLFLEEKWKS